MDSMPRRLILLVAGSALLLAPLLTIQLATGAGRAHACSCHPNPPPLEALNGSAAVFSGKVVSSGTFSFEHYWSVEIEVDTVWKGPVTSTTFVYTTYGPTCGYEWFERGKDFLVYAYEGYESDETLYASLCSRTRPFEYAEEDLQELGDGWAPDTGVTGALPASTPVVVASDSGTTDAEPTPATERQTLDSGTTDTGPTLVDQEQTPNPGETDAALDSRDSFRSLAWWAPLLAGLAAAALIIRRWARRRERG